MNEQDELLAKELSDLVIECDLLAKELPIYAAAGKIILFPKILGSLKLLIRRDSNGDDISLSRHKLHNAVKDFSAVVFEIQREMNDWSIAENEKRRITVSLQKIMQAAVELETLVKERRKR